MLSKDFKTRTETVNKEYPSSPGIWPIGLDIGYSGVKGISPNKDFCFPAYARKIPEDQVMLKEADNADIKYRDEDGTWAVGQLAYVQVISSEVVDSEAELFGRHRYYSSMYKVIARVGLALGLMKNSFGGWTDETIAVQTGLPPRYEKSDTPYIKDVLSGHHSFEVKFGTRPWMKFDFEINESNVFVMPQPMGALVSASIGFDGKPVVNSSRYFKKNIIVFDPGFGTLDDYPINAGSVVGNGETFPELGMREVFSRTCKEIYQVFNVQIEIPELQNKLETGEIMCTDIITMSRKKHDFSGILEKNCIAVCREAIEKMKIAHNYFRDVDYIIATGGTYEAWKETFDNVFRDMEGLEIIPANINDKNQSNIYGNVRGYYFYLLNARSKIIL